MWRLHWPKKAQMFLLLKMYNIYKMVTKSEIYFSFFSSYHIFSIVFRGIQGPIQWKIYHCLCTLKKEKNCLKWKV